MRWTWDEDKSRLNERKHGLDFDTARLVFDDPLMVHRPDPGLDEERWHTIGVVDAVAIIVVHTWPSFVPSDGGEVARIISARKATPHERRTYEEGEFE
ncbi:MAG: BrnT family toxin [Gammaproteobacteria bacterium]|nr:BrnT family toxin [Gammaproteobacteria bacterium]MDD9963835.1 BrnT family toxin [Gammaproteobacteria bacterium]MDE0270503.1 BrnT family toxin [Gammaproteobacteria bacterium]